MATATDPPGAFDWRWRGIHVFFLLVIARSMFACSCGERPDVRAVAPHAESIVTGIVVGRHPVVVRGSELRFGGEDGPFLYPVMRVDVAVTRVFKGDLRDRLELTEVGCCVCEYPFKVGKEYLIFAHPHSSIPNRSMASFCWPTKPLSRAAADLASLGTPLRTYPRRSEIRGGLRRSLDATHAAVASLIGRQSDIRVTLAAERRVIGWAVAIGALCAIVIILIARARRLKPRA